jgi:hypothetical protein
MDSKRRDERFLVRLSRDERDVLRKVAEQRDIPASQIVRHALKKALLQKLRMNRGSLRR